MNKKIRWSQFIGSLFTVAGSSIIENHAGVWVAVGVFCVVIGSHLYFGAIIADAIKGQWEIEKMRRRAERAGIDLEESNE